MADDRLNVLDRLKKYLTSGKLGINPAGVAIDAVPAAVHFAGEAVHDPGEALRGLVRGGLNKAAFGHAADIGNAVDPSVDWKKVYSDQQNQTPASMGVGGGLVEGAALGKLLGALGLGGGAAAAEAPAPAPAPVKAPLGDAPFFNNSAEASAFHGPDHPITKLLKASEEMGGHKDMTAPFEKPTIGTRDPVAIHEYMNNAAHAGKLWGDASPLEGTPADAPGSLARGGTRNVLHDQNRFGTQNAVEVQHAQPTSVGLEAPGQETRNLGSKTVTQPAPGGMETRNLGSKTHTRPTLDATRPGGEDWQKWEKKVAKEAGPVPEDDEDERF